MGERPPAGGSDDIAHEKNRRTFKMFP